MAKKQTTEAQIVDTKEVAQEVNPTVDLDAAYAKSEEFVEKNKNMLFMAAAALVLAVAGGFFFYNQSQEKEDEAQKQLFPAQYYFAQDSMDIVLKGNGQNVVGVETIAEDFSGTKAANLAVYYAGVAYLKKGEYAKAIENLEKFSSSDLLVQARAYALIGDANMELNKVDEAIAAYKKASEYRPNKQYTPKYLMKLAVAYEQKKEYASAVESYSKIIDAYPQSMEVYEAKKYKALDSEKTN